MIVAAGVLAATPPQEAQPPTAAQLRARLAAYEKAVEDRRPNPEELSAIAKGVMARSLLPTAGDALVVACSSKVWTDPECPDKLRAMARRKTAAVEPRARAAAALVALKDKEAAAGLLAILKPLPLARLAALAPTLEALPAKQSAPLLDAMLESNTPDVQVAACRTLAHIDAPETRQSLAAYLAKAPKGTVPWYSCVLASAQLGDPANQQMARYITNYLAGDELLAAADLWMTVDRDRAISHLQQITRESRGLARFEAAERLAPTHPEEAQTIMDQGLADDRPEIKAAALELHRVMRIEPSREVRALLLDPDPVVAIRAAETILAADERRRGGHVAPVSD